MTFVSFAKKNKPDKSRTFPQGIRPRVKDYYNPSSLRQAVGYSGKVRDKKYHWTYHVQDKMRYYNLSPSRITRIIRHPKRIEEGIAPKTTAVMSPYGGSPEGRQLKQSKKPTWFSRQKSGEIWVMYQQGAKGHGKIKIISAWRYPGKSPEHNPVPRDILEEVRDLLKF